MFQDRIRATTPLPTQADLVIIGAGPHALTCATYLLRQQSSLCHKFLVLDPGGTWMSQWQYQFAALQISHLRSPAVHHPDPHPYALRGFAASRLDELLPPYDRPSTRLFQDFCHNLIQRWQLQARICQAKVTDIEPLVNRVSHCFRLWLQTGASIQTQRVVLATGGSSPRLPDWVTQISSPYPEDRLLHSQRIDLRNLHLHDERVLIVGGGLTSGHLAVGAMSRGAKVVLTTRRSLRQKLFDADPGWLGPKYLKRFWLEPDWHVRWQMIQSARDGGSLTPEMNADLQQYRRDGMIDFHEQCQVVQAIWQGHQWDVHYSDGTRQSIDRIWLATGSQFDVTQEPLLKEIKSTYPIPIVKGLPVLEPSLRWPGCELFLTGGLAALQIGPVARNLSGARMASDRIVSALARPHSQYQPVQS